MARLHVSGEFLYIESVWRKLFSMGASDVSFLTSIFFHCQQVGGNGLLHNLLKENLRVALHCAPIIC